MGDGRGPVTLPARLRSVLFCPANRADRVAKLARCRADLSVVDLEDAVGPADKDSARRIAVPAVDALRRAEPDLPVFIRVNGAATPWFVADVVAAAGSGATGLVLPKLVAPADVDRLRTLLARHGRPDLPVIGGIETAAGVVRCEELALAAVDGLYFGAEDLIADVGGRRTVSGDEVLYARSRVLLAATVAGLPALDQVVQNFGDGERFLADAHRGRDLGYVGKMCVHPAQVALANQVFSPSAEELAQAREVVAAYEIAQRTGAGVAVVNGAMIDGPHLAAARRVLAVERPPAVSDAEGAVEQ